MASLEGRGEDVVAAWTSVDYETKGMGREARKEQMSVRGEEGQGRACDPRWMGG